ncbi:MAG TPA: ribonuclease P protein component [Acidobacteriaceae bacterium]|jgi:ribonuclease P protein component|nr:ribonuclease P protein component [Acidobacteriaceae bacterium]
MPSLVHHRLRKHADFQRVYKAGRKQFARQMAWFVALRDEAAAAHCPTPGPRIGLTVPKALGKAVARNRIKRRLREAVRRALPLLSLPVDLVLHPRASVLDADFSALEAEVAAIFRSVEASGGHPPASTSRKPAGKPVTR